MQQECFTSEVPHFLAKTLILSYLSRPSLTQEDYPRSPTKIPESQWVLVTKPVLSTGPRPDMLSVNFTIEHKQQIFTNSFLK